MCSHDLHHQDSCSSLSLIAWWGRSIQRISRFTTHAASPACVSGRSEAGSDATAALFAVDTADNVNQGQVVAGTPGMGGSSMSSASLDVGAPCNAFQIAGGHLLGATVHEIAGGQVKPLADDL